MDEATLRERFAGWRSRHSRTAWTPVIGAGPRRSRFGGAPEMPAGEAWPVCAGCDDPMRFFLQVDLDALPPGAPGRGTGLLQLFYCSRDDGKCETWSPFSGTHLVRILKGSGAETAAPPDVETFPAGFIEGWAAEVDAPDPQEHEPLGIVYDYDFRAKSVTVRCAEFGIELPALSFDLSPAETISTASAGDKWGGWPNWVQGVEYPACPECAKPMRLLLQVDSEDNVPYMFGDVGCGHITQCPEHTDVLAFGWACG